MNSDFQPAANMAPYLSDPSIETPFKADYSSYITHEQVKTERAQLEGDALKKVLRAEDPSSEPSIDPK